MWISQNEMYSISLDHLIPCIPVVKLLLQILHWFRITASVVLTVQIRQPGLVSDKAVNVTGIAKANKSEAILPWGKDTGKKIDLGASVGEAFSYSAEYRAANKDFASNPYLLSYRYMVKFAGNGQFTTATVFANSVNLEGLWFLSSWLLCRPETEKVHVVLRDKASAEDCLEATFHAHLFLHLLSSSKKGTQLHPRDQIVTTNGSNMDDQRRGKTNKMSNQNPDWMGVLAESRAIASDAYEEFRQQSKALGWKLHATMLNPKDSRLLGTL